MKRLEPKDIKVKKSKSKVESQQSASQSENKCLIRVYNSKKKISTIINSKDVNRFQLVSHFHYFLRQLIDAMIA